jgi:hypothetical protein
LKNKVSFLKEYLLQPEIDKLELNEAETTQTEEKKPKLQINNLNASWKKVKPID